MKNLFTYKKFIAILLSIVIVFSTALVSCRRVETIISSGGIEYVSQSVIINQTTSEQQIADSSSSVQNGNVQSDNKGDDNVSSNTSSQVNQQEIIIESVNPYRKDNTDPDGLPLGNVNQFTVDTTSYGKTVNSLFDNINLWNVGAPSKDSNYNIFEFTDYVQLMQCSGGTGSRDLFINPADSTVLDDYNFTRLVNACRGIINMGAKPHLKLGGVPLKYSQNYQNGAFGMNTNPPDDYNVYYDYIYALAKELVNTFGKQEVLSWRFGVMTEYENKDWFMHPSGDAEQTKIAYFKLYDYTVQALIDAIGNDVFVGAHSMTVTEGQWDEAEFIKHVAQGTNYATGKKCTKINFLAASYYQDVAGAPTPKSQKDFVETINYLRDNAKKYGLNNLVYGIDEGRMLQGINSGSDSFALNTRTVGYTYQGAFDARLFRDAVLNDIDYFSSWGFVNSGLPSISYYIAKHTAEFKGMKHLTTQKTATSSRDADIQAVSAYDPDTKILRIMAYNFKNSYDYKDNAKLSFSINAPVSSGNVKITKRFVDDNCNYFDEWLEDRKTYNITDDKFSWSPDDPGIEIFLSRMPSLENTYRNTLKPKYQQAAKLTPKTQNATVSGGKLNIEDTLMGNGVVFYEIQF